MKNLRVGVVGVGHIGKNHARLYAETEAVDFTAIYDTDATTAADIAQQYEVRATNSLEEFSELIDAASVATPTNSHFAIAQPLLEKGKASLDRETDRGKHGGGEPTRGTGRAAATRLAGRARRALQSRA